MNIKIFSTAATIVAAVLVGPAAAQAAVVTTVYQGHIGVGTDGYGLFGSPGASLAGLSYTGTFVSDDSKPGAMPITGALTGVSCSNDVVPCMALSGSIKIGGWTVYLDPEELATAIDYSNVETGQMYQHPYGTIANPVQAIDHTIKFDGQTSYDNISYFFHNGITTFGAELLGGANYGGPIDYTVQPDDMFFGSFVFEIENKTTHAKQTTQAFFVIDTIRSFADGGSSSAVPEPATWGLMVAGFFGLGLALRLRNRQARFA